MRKNKNKFIKGIGGIKTPDKRKVGILSEAFVAGKSGTPDLSASRFTIQQWEYLKVMGLNPSYHQSNEDSLERPVEKVNCYDCVEFCNKLSELEGFEPCYKILEDKSIEFNPDTGGYYMPTDKEWLHLATGGIHSKGYDYSGSNDPSLVGWTDGNSGNETHQVGMLAPNELSLFDMSGNVWVWLSSSEE